MAKIVLQPRVSVDTPNFTLSYLSNIEWLVATFPHRSAPAIRSKKGYRTLGRTISEEQAISYWRSPKKIIAQRFTKETWFFALDVDAGSQYRTPEAIAAIKESLEAIGIAGTIICQSSHSGGIHIYGPLPKKRGSFAIARTIKGALEDAGFELKPGQLEIFPNQKTWTKPGTAYPKGQYHGLPDYNAFRLPCQPGTGFFILNEDLDPIGESLKDFRHQWEWCESQQDIEALDKAIAHYRDAELLWEIAAMECEDFNGDTSPLKAEPIRANGEAIEGDILDILGRDCRENDYQDETPSLATMKAHYNALKKRGWQGPDETQAIIKHLCRLTRIFVFTATADDLAQKVEAIATSLPGFYEYSDHSERVANDIDQVCRAWARTTYKKPYYYCGDRQSKKANGTEVAEPVTPINPTNEARHQKAVDRFRRGLTGMVKNGFSFPNKTAVIDALLKQVKGSKTTIQKCWESLKDLAEKLINPEEPETPDNNGSKKSTHPIDSKYIHSVFCATSALGADWNPFDCDVQPPPPPKPITFLGFREQAIAHDCWIPDNLSYLDIPRLIQSAFSEMVRVAYCTDYLGIEQAIGELNRCDAETIYSILDWLKSFPSVPEGDRPLPPKLTTDEFKEAKRMKRKATFQRFKAMLGG